MDDRLQQLMSETNKALNPTALCWQIQIWAGPFGTFTTLTLRQKPVFRFFDHMILLEQRLRVWQTWYKDLTRKRRHPRSLSGRPQTGS